MCIPVQSSWLPGIISMSCKQWLGFSREDLIYVCVCVCIMIHINEYQIYVYLFPAGFSEEPRQIEPMLIKQFIL